MSASTDSYGDTRFVEDVLREAAELARRYFGRVGGVRKAADPSHVLTEADVEIGRFLVGEIARRYPDHNIIDEETGIVDKSSSWTWLVDPIDGTSNFAAGLPHFGIQIGLLREDVPVLGGIHLPAFDELLVAERGRGCTLNNEPVFVTSTNDLSDVLVAYGIDGHRESPETTQQECAALARIVLSVRNLRASNSAYDAVQVARGRYGAWINKTTKIWDQVPQQIVLEEAGCLYTDIAGNPMDYADPLKRVDDNFTMCAAPPALHEQLLKLLR